MSTSLSLITSPPPPPPPPPPVPETKKKSRSYAGSAWKYVKSWGWTSTPKPQIITAPSAETPPIVVMDTPCLQIHDSNVMTQLLVTPVVVAPVLQIPTEDAPAAPIVDTLMSELDDLIASLDRTAPVVNSVPENKCPSPGPPPLIYSDDARYNENDDHKNVVEWDVSPQTANMVTSISSVRRRRPQTPYVRKMEPTKNTTKRAKYNNTSFGTTTLNTSLGSTTVGTPAMFDNALNNVAIGSSALLYDTTNSDDLSDMENGEVRIEMTIETTKTILESWQPQRPQPEYFPATTVCDELQEMWESIKLFFAKLFE